MDAASEARACAALGTGLCAVTGVACVGGGFVTAGGTTIATPYCVAGGAVAGCAAGVTIDKFINVCAGGVSDAWNWMFSDSAEENDEYTGHGENPEGKTGSGSNWQKHSEKRFGKRTGVNRNNKRGGKNKKIIKSPNPNKR